MRIGIVGLGLIGGSLAKAYKRAGAEVLGADVDAVTSGFAKLSGACDGDLTEENLSTCDALFLAVTTGKTIQWLQAHADKIGPDTLVIDCCGIKRQVCQVGFRLSAEQDLCFVGGHPMAGRQVGGFKNSHADMFDGAVFVIVPPDRSDIRLLTRVKNILSLAGFSRFAVMTAEEHDRIVAFTSQMSHLISNAFVKSETAGARGTQVVGGSFRDMTRVAYLDEEMWTELFMENRDHLLMELDAFLAELGRYRTVLAEEDRQGLTNLLAEGKKRKEEVEHGTQ